MLDYLNVYPPTLMGPRGVWPFSCCTGSWSLKESSSDWMTVRKGSDADTQPLFSTEFSYWAILILLLFISLITIWIGRRRRPFEYPGSAGAGPRQDTTEATWRRQQQYTLTSVLHSPTFMYHQGLLSGSNEMTQIACFMNYTPRYRVLLELA